jgi:hypothetical protein
VRVVFYALALVVACSSLYILTFTPAPGPVALPPADPPAPLRVFVLAWGYHSSIFVEQPSGWRLGPPGREDAPFVEYGWGDRRYMMESNYTPLQIFASAMLPTSSVVYVCAHDRSPDVEVVGGEVYVRDCDAAEIRRLVTVLEGQMAPRTREGGRPPVFPETPEYPGRFYPGREDYVLWWNCNMWTARMLHEAGFEASHAFIVSPWQIRSRLGGFRDAR